jgi:glycosyltransferase involved in cell wall biosynthesis
LLPGDADLRFILVGDGVDLTDIKKAVPVLFQDKILFTGKRADVESIIQVMNIGVLLTNSKVHGEGISNSIIEYMALGKPVLATRGGGTDEIVQDGKNGYLLDPESSAQLVQRIRELKNNRSLCEQFGEAGRKLVREQFNLESMTAKYKEIYHRIINERRNA